MTKLQFSNIQQEGNGMIFGRPNQIAPDPPPPPRGRVFPDDFPANEVRNARESAERLRQLLIRMQRQREEIEEREKELQALIRKRDRDDEDSSRNRLSRAAGMIFGRPAPVEPVPVEPVPVIPAVVPVGQDQLPVIPAVEPRPRGILRQPAQFMDDDDDDGNEQVIIANNNEEVEDVDDVVQNGDGLLTRDAGVLPPSVQKLLNSVGSETINKITVWRQPISVNQALKNMGLKLPYDNIFHLAVNLNGKYNLQKNEYIKFTTGKPEGEKLELNVGTPMTFDELFLKTKNRVGAEKFTEYDAETNNCQVFVTNILKTLGSFTPEANKFVNQDAEKIFKSLGGPFAKFITGVAVKASQIVNKIQEGGEEQNVHNFYYPKCKLQF